MSPIESRTDLRSFRSLKEKSKRKFRDLVRQSAFRCVTEIFGQGWEFVDVLASVFRMRYAVSELKVERLQQAVPKEVPFNHSKIVNGLTADGELDAVRKRAEAKGETSDNAADKWNENRLTLRQQFWVSRIAAWTGIGRIVQRSNRCSPRPPGRMRLHWLCYSPRCCPPETVRWAASLFRTAQHHFLGHVFWIAWNLCHRCSHLCNKEAEKREQKSEQSRRRAGEKAHRKHCR